MSRQCTAYIKSYNGWPSVVKGQNVVELLSKLTKAFVKDTYGGRYGDSEMTFKL